MEFKVAFNGVVFIGDSLNTEQNLILYKIKDPDLFDFSMVAASLDHILSCSN